MPERANEVPLTEREPNPEGGQKWEKGMQDRRQIPRPEGYQRDPIQVAIHIDRALNPKNGRFIDPDTGELKEEVCGADFDVTAVRHGVFQALFAAGAKAIHERAQKAATPDEDEEGPNNEATEIIG